MKRLTLTFLLTLLFTTNGTLLAAVCTATKKTADYSADNGSANTASVTANINAVGDLVAITAWCYPSCSPVSVTLGGRAAVQTSVSGINGAGDPGTGQGFIFYVLSAPASGPQTLTFTASGSHSDIQTSYIDFAPSSGCTFRHDVDSPVGTGTGATVNTPSITPTPGDLLFNFTYITEHIEDVNSPWSCPIYSGPGGTGTCEFVSTINAAAYILSASSGSTANNMTLIHPSDSWQALMTSFAMSSNSGPPPVLLSSLACNPNSLGPNSFTACAVTLTQPAPTGGATVALTNSNSTLTVPAAVTVAAAATTATFNASTATVGSNQSAALTATYNNSSANATISLVASTMVSSLACNPTSLGPNSSSTCTVTLTQAAPTGGATVALTNSNSTLTVPASVTVAAAATTATFNASTATIGSNQSAALTAAYNSSSANATISLVASAQLSSLACNPTSLGPNSSSTCTVTLTQAAPTGGATVALTNSNSTLTVPASVTVAAAATTATFNASTATIGSNQSAALTATYNSSSANATISLVASAQLSSLACNPNSLGPNSSTTCTVTLTQAAPAGGATVALTNSNSILTVPASVTVAAAATTATFNASTATIGSNQSAALTATYNSSSANATISLVASAQLSSLACNPTSLGPNSSSTCTVTLTQAAPTGGATVALTNSNSTLTVPASVTVAPAATSATFNASTATIGSNQSATLTATYDSSSANATISLVTASSGLIAAYSFDEGTGNTVADASGNGINGTTSRTSWTTSGKYGNALSFNGTSSYVDLGNSSILRVTGSMTWSAWVKVSGNPSDDGQIVACSDNSIGWQLKISPDTGVRTFAVAVTPSGGSSHTQRYSKTVYKLNTWYYVAGVFNAEAQNLDIYVNGVLDDGVLTGAVPNLQAILKTNTTIGKRSGGYNFMGIIDNVRIYSRPLSAADIQTDMNLPVTGTAPAASLMPTTAPHPVQPVPSANKTAIAGRSLQAQPALSALSCSSHGAIAGSVVTCALYVSRSAEPVHVQLASSTPQVKVPAAVVTRPNQSSLTFQASVGILAKPQSAILTATLGDVQVQGSLLVVPAERPTLVTPQKQMAKVGTPVHFTVSAADESGLPVQLQARNLPALASFAGETGRFAWIPTAPQKGEHTVTFIATNRAGVSSTAEATIDVDDGVPALDPVLNKQQLACSPGAIATVTGKWLSTADSELSDPSGKAMDLAGTKVKVNGQYVPVLLTSPTQVRLLCPALDPGTEIEVAVETAAGVTEPLRMPMQSASPSILPLGASDKTQGVVSFVDTTELAMPRNFKVPAHPAQPGDEILIWGSGFGSPTGSPTEVSTRTISVKLGGVEADVESVRAVPDLAGVYAVQVRVPVATVFGDSVAVQLQVIGPDGRQFSSNTVTISIEPIRP